MAPTSRHTPVDLTFYMIAELLSHTLRDMGTITSSKAPQVFPSELAGSIDTLYPDFYLAPHLPRRRRVRFPAVDERVIAMDHGDWGSFPHQIRCYDVLTTRVTMWEEFNLIVASAFSGFSGYELRW